MIESKERFTEFIIKISVNIIIVLKKHVRKYVIKIFLTY